MATIVAVTQVLLVIVARSRPLYFVLESGYARLRSSLGYLGIRFIDFPEAYPEGFEGFGRTPFQTKKFLNIASQAKH